MPIQLLMHCSVLYVDHLAVTTSVFSQTLNEYLSMTGSRLLKGPAINNTQKVEYAFVQLQGGITVEILGIMDSSPILGHVLKGGGPNHICYAVADIEKSISKAINAGAKILCQPIPDVAFDGRRVAFLFCEQLGVFEFLEAFPIGCKNDAREILTGESSIPDDVVPYIHRPINEISEKTIDQLLEIFSRIFPKVEVNSIKDARYNISEGWDSLNHLRLIMAVEDKFNLNVNLEDMTALSSFDRIHKYLINKI